MTSQKNISNMKSQDDSVQIYIDLALEKANTAVKYDTSNDFQNAICAYTEAVDLLAQVLQSPTNGSDTEGLKSICNIYRERIEFLSYLKATEINSKTQNDNQRSSYDNSNISSIPVASKIQNATSTSGVKKEPTSASSKQHSFNSVLMNFFSKKATKKKKSSHNTLFNFIHHSNDIHHTSSIDIQPKTSKSSPVFPLEHSKWSKQGRARSHHMSSDNILSHQHGARSFYTSPSHSSTSAATLLYFQQYQPKSNDDEIMDIKNTTTTTAVNKRNSHSDNADDYNKPSASDNNHDRRQQKPHNTRGPFISEKQYNKPGMVPGGNYCYPSLTSAITNDETQQHPSSASKLTTSSLPIPRKSSQRRKRLSPPPLIPLHECQEPVRDSSLNNNLWRPTVHNDSSFVDDSQAYIIPTPDTHPPVLSDKSEKRASTSSIMSKRISASRLKTTFSLTNTIKSGGAISLHEETPLSPTPSIVSHDSLTLPIKSVKIDPSIIMSYPEANVVVSNENIVNTFGGNIVESTPI
ncbi:MAG: hypothetical protein EXX96DRAFT_611913 [Benjaminiella poitrasii]|nr:MAG: hypothetical protein EXX96DRAFT_611913 [Benjaminiella poitrasii]